MRLSSSFHAASGVQQPARFGALMLVTGLVLTLQSPEARDSAARLLAELDLPNPANVLEWRPDSPPPWLDGDSLLREETEETPTLASASRDPEALSDPRQRPER
jgi:hypothetical protein